MRWKIVTLAFFSIFFITQAVWAESLAVKATTPVKISIISETSVSAGSVSTFVVRATSVLPSENFVIEVEAPQGSRWLSGEKRWQGPIAPGKVQELRFTLQMPANAVASISATASIQAGDGSQLAASAVYRQQAISPIGSQKSSAARKVTRDGRPVVEYRVR